MKKTLMFLVMTASMFAWSASASATDTTATATVDCEQIIIHIKNATTQEFRDNRPNDLNNETAWAQTITVNGDSKTAVPGETVSFVVTAELGSTISYELSWLGSSAIQTRTVTVPTEAPINCEPPPPPTTMPPPVTTVPPPVTTVPPPVTTVPPPAPELPRTGSETVWMALAGATLATAGYGLVKLRKRFAEL